MKEIQIWVDADACPKVIKEILYRVADRVRIVVTFLANRALRVPESDYIKSIQVAQGFDVADNHIVQMLNKGDLVITADIPLAAEVIREGGHALDPRGDFYTEENIQGRLSIRNFMDELRSGGVETGGPSSFKMKDRHRFANQLDQFLTKRASSDLISPNNS